MTIELRCASCGMGFLVDESAGHDAPCPACGATLGPQSTASSAKPAAAPPRPVDAAPPRAPRKAEKTASPKHGGDEMVCPRCGLHFTPRATNKAPARRSARRTILVVEDVDYFKDIARDALEPQFQVRAAGTVNEAQHSLADGEVDLILLDLTLRGGEDGVRLLRELPPEKPCPILIFTSEDEQVMYGDTWKHLQDLGADDVVIKGMNVGESILRKVGSMLGEPTEDDSTTTA